jgi:hypothetical protein
MTHFSDVVVCRGSDDPDATAFLQVFAIDSITLGLCPLMTHSPRLVITHEAEVGFNHSLTVLNALNIWQLRLLQASAIRKLEQYGRYFCLLTQQECAPGFSIRSV